jgi:hypothetical protein
MAVTFTHENLDDGSERVITVTAVGGDTSGPIAFGAWADASVQFAGSFGTSTVSIEGSNDGTNWAVLNDAQGNALSAVNTGKIEQILESVRYKRVVVSAGTGAVSVIFYLRKAQPLRT